MATRAEAARAGTPANTHVRVRACTCACAKCVRTVQVRRLRREISLALELSHPRLLRAMGTILLARGAPCLVMEYMVGGSLAQLLHSTPSAGRTHLHSRSSSGGSGCGGACCMRPAA